MLKNFSSEPFCSYGFGSAYEETVVQRNCFHNTVDVLIDFFFGGGWK